MMCSELLCLLVAIVSLFECSVDELMKITFCLTLGSISRVSYMNAAEKLAALS